DDEQRDRQQREGAGRTRKNHRQGLKRPQLLEGEYAHTRQTDRQGDREIRQNEAGEQQQREHAGVGQIHGKHTYLIIFVWAGKMKQRRVNLYTTPERVLGSWLVGETVVARPTGDVAHHG